MKAKAMRPVFSGPSSRQLWRDINAVKDKRVHWALYSIGCACQELEAKVDRLQRVLITPLPGRKGGQS